MKIRFLLILSISLLAHFSTANATVEQPVNIIMMIADGCGYAHIDALHSYKDGTAGDGIFSEFSKLAMSTYSLNGNEYDSRKAWSNFNYVLEKPTDSSAAATALSTGSMTENGKIGVDKSDRSMLHITERAKGLGKSAGVVTTVQLSHATPAGFVAHATSRNNFEEIGRYMILESDMDVIVGAGHPLYDNNGDAVSTDALTSERFMYVGGKEVWDAILAGTAGTKTNSSIGPWTFIESRDAFQRMISEDNPPQRLLGIPKVEETLQQKRGGNADASAYEVPLLESVPNLSEMSLAALNVLCRNDSGFFLMIEGGGY